MLPSLETVPRKAVVRWSIHSSPPDNVGSVAATFLSILAELCRSFFEDATNPVVGERVRVASPQSTSQKTETRSVGFKVVSFLNLVVGINEKFNSLSSFRSERVLCDAQPHEFVAIMLSQPALQVYFRIVCAIRSPGWNPWGDAGCQIRGRRTPTPLWRVTESNMTKPNLNVNSQEAS